MLKGLGVCLAVVLALVACDKKKLIDFRSNMDRMPVVGAAYYENPLACPAQGIYSTLAFAIESVTTTAVNEGLPGIVVIVNAPEFGTWVSAKGSIDLKNKIPIKPNSLSRIGSITKIFTAVVIHRLAQEGQLSLEDRVSTFLPKSVTHGIPNIDSITVRQLLGHTSGIVNYTDHLDIAELIRTGTNRNLTSRKALDLVRHLPPTFDPGTECRYSNTGYIILGLIPCCRHRPGIGHTEGSKRSPLSGSFPKIR